MVLYKKKWEELLEQSHWPWWEWDVRANEVIFNDLKALMLGYDPAQFKGKGFEAFTEILHPEDFDAAMQAMREVLAQKTNLYQTDYRIKRADGTYSWYMDRGIVMKRDGDGKPLVIRGLVIDLGREADRGTDIEALKSVVYSTGIKDLGQTSFITLCSTCHRVKKPDNDWTELPEDIKDFLSENVSHSICPTCIRKLYPDDADRILEVIATKI